MRFSQPLAPISRNRNAELNPELLLTLLAMEREINALKSVFTPRAGS